MSPTTRIFAAIAAATLLAGAVAGAEPEVVGRIVEIVGDAGAVTVTRGAREIPVRPQTPLYAGDRIRVGDASTSVRICIDTEYQEVDAAAAGAQGYLVKPSPNAAPTPLGSNLALLLQELLSGEPAAGAVDVQLNLLTRGDRIEIPLLDAERSRLAARESLHLAWVDGTPPFSLRLLRVLEARREEVLHAELSERHGSWAIDLRPGTYVIDLRDDEWTALASFEVVERQEVPTRPPRPREASLPVPARAALDHVWLARQEKGDWLLEAYQHFARLGEARGTAAQLAAELARRGPAAVRSVH